MIVVSELTKKNKVEDNERVKKNSNFSRASHIIYTLQTSLDFDRGGEIAIQLFQVYEFCRKQLIKEFYKKSR